MYESLETQCQSFLLVMYTLYMLPTRYTFYDTFWGEQGTIHSHVDMILLNLLNTKKSVCFYTNRLNHLD